MKIKQLRDKKVNKLLDEFSQLTGFAIQNKEPSSYMYYTHLKLINWAIKNISPSALERIINEIKKEYIKLGYKYEN